jgi:asparaginyl-tRNA synthetase
LNDNMDLAEDFIQYVIKYTLRQMSWGFKILEGLLDEENQNHKWKKRNGFAWKIKFVLRITLNVFSYRSNWHFERVYPK